MLIVSDHVGFKLIKCSMDRLGGEIEFVDLGAFDESSTDYPIYAAKVAELISSGKYQYGILICGTGIGMSIVANKYPGVRAALVYSIETAVLAKKHNNANVICLGGRLIDCDKAIKIILTWLKETFEGGRHLRRLREIEEIERKNFKIIKVD